MTEPRFRAISGTRYGYASGGVVGASSTSEWTPFDMGCEYLVFPPAAVDNPDGESEDRPLSGECD